VIGSSVKHLKRMLSNSATLVIETNLVMMLRKVKNVDKNQMAKYSMIIPTVA